MMALKSSDSLQLSAHLTLRRWALHVRYSSLTSSYFFVLLLRPFQSGTPSSHTQFSSIPILILSVRILDAQIAAIVAFNCCLSFALALIASVYLWLRYWDVVRAIRDVSIARPHLAMLWIGRTDIPQHGGHHRHTRPNHSFGRRTCCESLMI